MNQRRESFSTISTRRMEELTGFRDYLSELDVKKMLTISKLSIENKDFICSQIVKNIKTGDFYDDNAKENCVDDLVSIMLMEIQSLIMESTGCKNLKRSRELSLHGIFRSEDEEEVVKRRVEFLIFASKDKEKVDGALHNPILVIENKRPSLQVLQGLNQSLLALYTMDIHCNHKTDVYAILFTGYGWRLVKHEYSDKRISMSKEYPFIPPKGRLDSELLVERSLLLDVIFSIIVNYLKN